MSTVFLFSFGWLCFGCRLGSNPVHDTFSRIMWTNASLLQSRKASIGVPLSDVGLHSSMGHLHNIKSYSLLRTTLDGAFQRIGDSASTFASRRLLLDPDFENRYTVLEQRVLPRYLLAKSLLVELWSPQHDEVIANGLREVLEPAGLGVHYSSLRYKILEFLFPWDGHDDYMRYIMYRHAVYIRLANYCCSENIDMRVPSPDLHEWSKALWHHWQATWVQNKKMFHPLEVR